MGGKGEWEEGRVGDKESWRKGDWEEGRYGRCRRGVRWKGSEGVPREGRKLFNLPLD